MVRLSFAVTAFAILGSASAHAEVDAYTVYQSLKSSQPTAALTFLSGVERGLATANALLRERGREMLYCRPEEAALTIAKVQEIYSEEYETVLKSVNEDALKTMPPSIILAQGLGERFPCAAGR